MRELERRNADNEFSVLRNVAELRSAVAAARAADRTVGLVPTMGAFHRGHLSLMRRARGECDLVAVSLFVNPAQFEDAEDLEAYPRDELEDAKLAQAEGVDLLFVPDREEVYPPDFATTVEVRGLTDVLCGEPSSRGSDHFRGVTTVMAKLLNMCQPDVAYFGQKDFQQALVIERMVCDLDIPVQIEICATVREDDGLAMSSRNAYLSADERERAPALKRALDAAAREVGEADEMRRSALAELATVGIEPEYLEILDASDLSPVESVAGKRVVVAIAARVGRARLIDNIVIEGPTSGAGAPQQPSAVAAA